MCDAKVRTQLAGARAEIIDRWQRQLNAAADAGFALDPSTAWLLPRLLDATGEALLRRFRPVAPSLDAPAARARRAAVHASLLGDLILDVIAERCPDGEAELSAALTHAAVEVSVRAALEREQGQRARRSELLVRLGHEMRNAMTAALLSLDLLRRQGALTGTAGRGLARNLELLHEQVEDALLAEVLDAGTLTRKRVKLGSLLAGAELQRATVERRVRLELLPAASKGVDADPRLLGPAMKRLVGGAAALSRRGGTVRVEARTSAAGARIAVRVDRRERDEGPSSSTPGVSLARRVARAHGGRLRLRGLEGEGCSFTLDLPRT